MNMWEFLDKNGETLIILFVFLVLIVMSLKS